MEEEKRKAPKRAKKSQNRAIGKTPNESTAASTNKKNVKKAKRKPSKKAESPNDEDGISKPAENETTVVRLSKVRDFSNDLKEYLSSWRVREETGQWKFNKVLQAWALDNCFEKEKMDASLFKELIPYILTVKGAALDRLSKLALEIINGKINSEDTGDSTKPNLKRALKIHQYLTGA